MRPHDGSNRVWEAHALQDFGAHHRMNLHLLEFFAGQLAGLRDDVLRHGEFADVVQQRGGAQRLQLRFVQAQFLAHFDRVHLHPLQMIVRGMVLGFNGQRQSLDSSQVERSHLFGVFLLVFHPAQIEVVRAVDQVDHRDGQQRSLPSEVTIDGAGRGHDQRAEQIVGERPDVAFAPDPAQRPVLSERNGARHRKGVHGEEHGGRHHHTQSGFQLAADQRARVINRPGGYHRERHAGHIEEHLMPPGRLPVIPQALHQNGRTADGQCFRL